MNQFLVYVNGALCAPGAFKVKPGDNGTIGRYALATSSGGYATDGTVDIFEIRGGSLVRRYHFSHAKDAEKDLKVSEEGVRIRCRVVANDF